MGRLFRPIAHVESSAMIVSQTPSAPPRELVDLFSGCGGTSAGFLSTGRFRHLYAADFDQWANQTYRLNLGHEPDLRDIRELVDSPELAGWAANLIRRATAPITLVACAPCQGFSSHVKTKSDRLDRNGLLTTIGPIAAQLRPREIFIENVPDVFATRNWRQFVTLRRDLETEGYSVRARIINFAQLGVPQERFRAVILARFGAQPTFPEPTHPRPSDYSTVRDWIADLPRLQSAERAADDPMHQASTHRRSTLQTISQVPKDGGNRPVGVGPRCLDATRSAHGGYTDVYGRLAWDSPAPTMTARCRTPSCGRFVHPEDDRGLTAREVAQLQTFPRDWTFVGPFDDRFKQAGNAVPPLAAAAFASHIAQGWPQPEVEIGETEIHDEPIGSSFSVLIPGIRRRKRVAAAANSD